MMGLRILNTCLTVLVTLASLPVLARLAAVLGPARRPLVLLGTAALATLVLHAANGLVPRPY